MWYRSKHKFHAIQWDGVFNAMVQPYPFHTFSNGTQNCPFCNLNRTQHGYITNEMGMFVVCPGDYLQIEDKKHYVHKKEEFENLYEKCS